MVSAPPQSVRVSDSKPAFRLKCEVMPVLLDDKGIFLVFVFCAMATMHRFHGTFPPPEFRRPRRQSSLLRQAAARQVRCSIVQELHRDLGPTTGWPQSGQNLPLPCLGPSFAVSVRSTDGSQRARVPSFQPFGLYRMLVPDCPAARKAGQSGRGRERIAGLIENFQEGALKLSLVARRIRASHR